MVSRPPQLDWRLHRGLPDFYGFPSFVSTRFSIMVCLAWLEKRLQFLQVWQARWEARRKAVEKKREKRRLEAKLKQEGKKGTGHYSNYCRVEGREGRIS